MNFLENCYFVNFEAKWPNQEVSISQGTLKTICGVTTDQCFIQRSQKKRYEQVYKEFVNEPQQAALSLNECESDFSLYIFYER